MALNAAQLAQRKKAREAMRRYREKHGLLPDLTPRPCLYCGQMFMPVQSRSKYCSSYHLQRAWALANPNRMREFSRRSYHKNKNKNLEKIRKQTRVRYWKNPDKYRKEARRWYWLNIDKRRAYSNRKREHDRALILAAREILGKGDRQ